MSRRTGATLIMSQHASNAGDDTNTIAKQDHADLAVVGSYQVAGDQLRVNAHLLDVSSGTEVGGFAATGSEHDLFKVEDALGEQLRRLLPRRQEITGEFQPHAPGSQPEPAVQPPPTVIYEQSPTAYYAPTPTPSYYESSPNYYPDYGYGYGYGLGYPGFFRWNWHLQRGLLQTGLLRI